MGGGTYHCEIGKPFGYLSNDGNAGRRLLQVPDVDDRNAHDGDGDWTNTPQKDEALVPLAQPLEEEEHEEPRQSH